MKAYQSIEEKICQCFQQKQLVLMSSTYPIALFHTERCKSQGVKTVPCQTIIKGNSISVNLSLEHTGKIYSFYQFDLYYYTVYISLYSITYHTQFTHPLTSGQSQYTILPVFFASPCFVLCLNKSFCFLHLSSQIKVDTFIY